jgi:hypothetical protein
MRLYYEAIEQRVSTVKGTFYIGFLCLKMTCLWGPENQIRTTTAIIPFDLIGHRAIDRSQKVDITVKHDHCSKIRRLPCVGRPMIFINASGKNNARRKYPAQSKGYFHGMQNKRNSNHLMCPLGMRKMSFHLWYSL